MLNAPNTDAATLKLVANEFGIAASQVRVYAGEHARNLRVIDTDGMLYLVKLSGETNPSTLDWQDSLLRELENKSLSFAVPRLLESRSGERRVATKLDGNLIHMRVTTWLPGDLLRDVTRYSPALLSSLGAASAELTEALSDVKPPANLPHHHWLIEDALESLDKELRKLPLSRERSTIEQIAEFCADGLAKISLLPHSTVHQDLHDQNVLVNSANHDRVNGVIDFDDAFYTARAADVAIAATYGMIRQADPLECFIAVVNGYLAVSPLTDEELAALLPMSVIRLAVNWTTWHSRNTKAIDPAYGSERSGDTWPLIQELVNRGLERTTHEIVSRVRGVRPIEPMERSG